MKKRIAIVSIRGKHDGSKDLLKKNSVIEFVHEPTNKKDPDAIRVLCNNEVAGYIANLETTMLEDTISASSFKRYLNNNETEMEVLSIVDKTEEDSKWDSYLLEIEIRTKRQKQEKKQEDVNFELSLGGVQSMFPERLKAIERIKDNQEVKIFLKSTDRGIEAFTVDDSIGVIKKTSKDFNKIEDAVKTKSVSGILSPASDIKSLKVIVNLSDNISIFDEYIDQIIIEGALSFEEVKERIQYMRNDLKLENKYIIQILNSIEPVSECSKGRLIKELKTKFVDYNGYLKESIIYLMKGKFLRYVGGKATGKNTAADTLCWLLNRPKGEVAMNEGLDKIDLTGSRIIDSDENGNMKMPFELSTFAQGLKEGWIIILDEVNTANPSLLTILHGLDSRKSLDIPGYGVIKVHPNASVILTMNEDYVGTMPLNEATVDRFTPIIFEDAKDIRDMLLAAIPNALQENIEICQQFYSILRELNNDSKISSYPISIRGFIDALDVSDELGLKRGIETNIVNKGIDKIERMVLSEELKLLFN